MERTSIPFGYSSILPWTLSRKKGEPMKLTHKNYVLICAKPFKIIPRSHSQQ